MLVIELITVVVMIVVAVRARPPAHSVSPRLLSTFATVALISLGVAIGALVIVVSGLIFGIALLIAGFAAASFLWLVRGGIDEDDGEGDEPPTEPPTADPHGSQRRFMHKRTTGSHTPSRRP